MGNDQRIVDAARLSIAGLDTKATSTTEGLIRHLFRSRHTTPFEKVVFEVDVKMPIFIARQLVRHRTQALNELSGRYSVIPDEFYVPTLGSIQGQATRNKQGRDGSVLMDAATFQKGFSGEAAAAFEMYGERIDAGMARELARINLPLSTYTQWWTTISLHNLLHLVGLRWAKDVQGETQAYGAAFAAIVERVCPITYQAFIDFQYEAMHLSRLDVIAVETLVQGGIVYSRHWPTKREREDFAEKATRLGLSFLWDEQAQNYRAKVRVH